MTERDLKQLVPICHEFGVKRLWLFGSAASGTMNADSDVDFALEFGPSALSPLEQFFGLQRRLEALIGRKVDLVEWSAVKNPFFRREVERTRREVYAA